LEFELTPEVLNLRKFVGQVFLPLCALIAATLVVLLVSELWSAHQANVLAAQANEELARTGFRLVVREVGSNVSATATWDDAVIHMHDQYDVDWAVENIGNWATKTLHFQMTFVVDPAGLTRFAMIEGKVTKVSIQTVLGDGLQPVLDRARAAPLGEAATGVARTGSRLAIVGAAAIHPHTDKLPTISGGYSILVYAEFLDASAIDEFRQAYLLDGLKLVDKTPSNAEGVLPLLTANGPPIAYLVWAPPRPGAQLLKAGLPSLGAVALAIALLGTIIFLHARRAADVLSESRQLALTDGLTGLPNRLLLHDRLQQALGKKQSGSQTVAVLCLDLDGFKGINDSLGHASGDELLRAVAGRFLSVLRESDMIARIGGDEFVVLQPATDRASTEAVAERLLATVIDAVALNDADVTVGVSIGIAFSAGDGERGSELLRRADVALYDAKGAGGHQFRIAGQVPNSLDKLPRDSPRSAGSLASAA
jgi:diguanylate cyclase (GGDEF)-like protein